MTDSESKAWKKRRVSVTGGSKSFKKGKAKKLSFRV